MMNEKDLYKMIIDISTVLAITLGRGFGGEL